MTRVFSLRVQRYVLVCIGVLVGGALVEGLLRITYPRMVGSFQGLYVLDPDIGYRMKSNLDVDYRTPDYTTHILSNSWGFRERDFSIANAPGMFRILVLGDSFVEALQVPLEQTFHKRLEDALNEYAGYRRYEVIALGVGGFGLIDEYAIWRSLGQHLHSDMVILMMHPNDVEAYLAAFSEQEGAMPSERVARLVHVRAARIYGTPFSRLLGSLHMYVLARNTLSRLPQGRSLYERVHHTAWYRLFITSQQRTRLTPQPFAQSSAAQMCWGLARVIGALADEVVTSGARFVLVAIPNPQQVIEPQRQHSSTPIEGTPFLCDDDHLDAFLGHVAKKYSFPFLALAFSLRAAHVKQAVYFRYDYHWTTYGHACVAEAIVAKLLSDEELLR